MALTTGNAAPTLTSAAVVTIPSGPCELVISNTSGVTVYVAFGAHAVTATNGFAIPTGAPPVTITTYPGSTGAPMNLIYATGSVTGVVSWAISTSQ